MKSTIILSLVFVLTLVSCSNASTDPIYEYKKSGGNGLALKVGDLKITDQELNKGIESELYEAQMKSFNIKFDKAKSLLLEKLIATDPKKKNLTNDQFLEKYITSQIKISKTQIENFIVERKIPEQHVNDALKNKISTFLKEGEKQKALEKWMNSKIGGKKIEIFFDKPQRPSFDVQVGNAPFVGGKDAKVEIVEFSDFQCPYCSKASAIISQLKAKYGNKIKVAFKQFPLDFHKEAQGAAIASLCANEQGMSKFWKLHDAMFANQSKLSIADLKSHAKNIGLDTKKFDMCLDGKKYLAQVKADIAQGLSIGVKSTPTFYVDGKLVNGAQPLSVFSEIIDAALK